MKKQSCLLSLLALLALLSACTSNKTASTSKPTSVASVPNASVSSASVPNAQSSNSQTTAPNPFPTPTTSAGDAKLLPVPQLIPPTTPLERMPQITTGRPDPFAALAVPATVSYKPAASTAPASPANVPTTPPMTAAPSVATAPITTMPPLPPLQPAPTNVNQLPTVTVPDRLAMPQSMAQAIEISGVVEVGGKTNVIVQVPDEHTSRYVEVGGYLANGKVLVKRVEMGAEPVVVLEENGAEVTRYIGGGSSLAGLM